jgi:hypothetical protein
LKNFRLGCLLVCSIFLGSAVSGHAQSDSRLKGVSPALYLLLLDRECSSEPRQITIEAIIGEHLRLGEYLFPELAAAVEEAMDVIWEQLDELYEQLAGIDVSVLPPEYQDFVEDEICWHLDEIFPPLIPVPADLQQSCDQLITLVDSFSNLQEVVNYGANYLWQSNNEDVVLVDDTGLALTTGEGVATITARASGCPTHTLTIDASRVVQTIRQLDMQNEKVLTVEDGKINTFSADGTAGVSVDIEVVSDEASGDNRWDVVLGNDGRLLVNPDQLIVFAPSTVFEDGAIRRVKSVGEDNMPVDGQLTITTELGTIAEVVNELDLEHKETVDEGASDITGSAEVSTTARTGDDAVFSLAPGVRVLSAEQFYEAVAARGTLDPSAPASLIEKAIAQESWNPQFAFAFDTCPPDGTNDMCVEGVVGFKMPIYLSLRVSDFELQRFRSSFRPTQYSDITIGVSGEADIEHTLAEVRGPSIKVLIGPLPVWVRPIFEVGVAGRSEGSVTLNVVDYEVWNEYGVKYDRGRSGPDWRPVAHYNRRFKDPSLVDGDFSLGAWGVVETKLRFYGLGGPYARALIGARLHGDTSRTQPEDKYWAWLRSFVMLILTLNAQHLSEYLTSDIRISCRRPPRACVA